MNLHLLSSSLVDYELRLDHNTAVIAPFAPHEEEDDEKGDNGDDAAGCSAHASIFDCLGESVQAREAGLGWHDGRTEEESILQNMNWSLYSSFQARYWKNGEKEMPKEV